MQTAGDARDELAFVVAFVWRKQRERRVGQYGVQEWAYFGQKELVSTRLVQFTADKASARLGRSVDGGKETNCTGSSRSG